MFVDVEAIGDFNGPKDLVNGLSPRPGPWRRVGRPGLIAAAPLAAAGAGAGVGVLSAQGGGVCSSIFTVEGFLVFS